MSLQTLPSRQNVRADDTVASYQYRPLLPAPKSTRLIQILPGAAGTDVRCYMLDYTIVDERVPGLYEALSYTWGDWADSKKVYVADGAAYNQSPDTSFHCLDVTNNLYTAMQHLRDTALPRTTWIDAICINQDDLIERAEQVKFMATIFSHAFRVVVWLGEEQAESAELFAILEDLAIHAGHTSEEVANIISSPYFNKGLITGPLKSLFARPWFHRIWVLQEVAVARYVTVCCGDAQLGGVSFATALKLLDGSDTERGMSPARTSSNVVRLLAQKKPVLGHRIPKWYDDQRRDFALRRKPSLGNLLDRFHRHQATDRRDKVFALLGMSDNNSTARVVVPDYTQEWAVVFRDVILQVLGPQAVVSTWNDLEQACITTYGCVLGIVIKRKQEQGSPFSLEKQEACICVWSLAVEGTRVGPWWKVEWSLDDPYCRNIKEGDILFLADGASQPSIIRIQGGCAHVVLLSVPPVRRYSAKSLVNNASDTFCWRSLRFSPLHNRRQVTMIWSWLSSSDDGYREPEVLLCAGLAGLNIHPPYSMRVHDCARIMGVHLDESDSIVLHQWVDTIELQKLTTGVRLAVESLRKGRESGGTYFRLKYLVAQVRWCFWSFYYNMQHNDPGMLRYISSECESGRLKEGFSRCCISDMLDLLDISAELDDDEGAITKSPDIPKTQMFLERHEDSIARRIVRAVLAQRKLESSGIRLTCERLLIASRKLHKYDGNIAVALALLSELQGGVLSISLATLTAIVPSRDALEAFSFLFLVCRKDPSTAYNILATVISTLSSLDRTTNPPRRCFWGAIRSHISPDWYIPSFTRWQGDLEDHGCSSYQCPGGTFYHFLAFNILVLRKHIEAPGLLEIAAAAVDDEVMSFLLHKFVSWYRPKPQRLDIPKIRHSILDGIDAYLEKSA